MRTILCLLLLGASPAFAELITVEETRTRSNQLSGPFDDGAGAVGFVSFGETGNKVAWIIPAVTSHLGETFTVTQSTGGDYGFDWAGAQSRLEDRGGFNYGFAHSATASLFSSGGISFGQQTRPTMQSLNYTLLSYEIAPIDFDTRRVTATFRVGGVFHVPEPACLPLVLCACLVFRSRRTVA